MLCISYKCCFFIRCFFFLSKVKEIISPILQCSKMFWAPLALYCIKISFFFSNQFPSFSSWCTFTVDSAQNSMLQQNATSPPKNGMLNIVQQSFFRVYFTLCVFSFKFVFFILWTHCRRQQKHKHNAVMKVSMLHAAELTV